MGTKGVIMLWTHIALIARQRVVRNPKSLDRYYLRARALNSENIMYLKHVDMVMMAFHKQIQSLCCVFVRWEGGEHQMWLSGSSQLRV